MSTTYYRIRIRHIDGWVQDHIFATEAGAATWMEKLAAAWEKHFEQFPGGSLDTRVTRGTFISIRSMTPIGELYWTAVLSKETTQDDSEPFSITGQSQKQPPRQKL